LRHSDTKTIFDGEIAQSIQGTRDPPGCLIFFKKIEKTSQMV